MKEFAHLEKSELLHRPKPNEFSQIVNPHQRYCLRSAKSDRFLAIIVDMFGEGGRLFRGKIATDNNRVIALLL